MTLLSSEEMNEVFSRWQKQNPSPESELDYVNAFTLLVAVVLSAQSTDKGVNKATEKLFKVADTPQKMRCNKQFLLISITTVHSSSKKKKFRSI